MPSTQVISHDPQKPLLRIRLITDPEYPFNQLLLSLARVSSDQGKETYPKMSSGCEKKSVIRSSRLLGSSTNVGRAIFERSIPGLTVHRLISFTPGKEGATYAVVLETLRRSPPPCLACWYHSGSHLQHSRPKHRSSSGSSHGLGFPCYH